MVAGMGALMGLCPQPDQFKIAELCADFGVLPSQLKDEDWEWLGIHSSRKWLVGWYQRWQQVAAGEGSMPQDVVQYLLDLYEKAEEQWGTND